MKIDPHIENNYSTYKYNPNYRSYGTIFGLII